MLFHHTLLRNTNYGDLYSLHTVGLRINTHEGFLNSHGPLLKRFCNIGTPGDTRPGVSLAVAMDSGYAKTSPDY